MTKKYNVIRCDYMPVKTPRRLEILHNVRRERIKQEPFSEQRLEDFENNLEDKKDKNKARPVFKLNPDGTKVVYYKGLMYRNFSKTKYLIWKALYDAGVSVEPVVGVENKPSKELSDVLPLEKDEIIVKSKIVGYGLQPLLLKYKMPLKMKFLIAKQIIEIMIKMWNLGYVHSHPHTNNFNVVFENGVLKVYLIDFAQSRVAEQNVDFQGDYSSLSIMTLDDLFKEDPNYKSALRRLLKSKIPKKFNDLLFFG